MEYLTTEEIKNRKSIYNEKLTLRPARRPLALKGRNVDIFKKYITDSKANILDIGTGSGIFLKVLHDSGYKNIFGLDLDNFLEGGIRGILKDFKTIDMNSEKIPWPDNSFDVVTAWEVFRIIKPSGLLIFSVPNIFHIVSRLVFLKRGLFPKWNETNNHISVFPRGIFEKMFLRYFSLIKEGYVYAKISLPGLNKVSKFLPENKWFGNWVYYILKKK